MQFFCCFYLCIHVESPYIALALYRVAGAGFKDYSTAVVGFNSHHNYQCSNIGFPCLLSGCNWQYCQCRACTSAVATGSIASAEPTHQRLQLAVLPVQSLHISGCNWQYCQCRAYTSAVATGSIASAEPTHQRLQLAVLPVKSRRYFIGRLSPVYFN